MEQQITLIVPCHGLLTILVGVFIVLKPLVQSGLAFGGREFLRCFVLCANGSIGFAFELVAAVKEVVKLMELITHPASLLASRSIAGGQADAPIGGHADTVEAVSAEVFTMRFPGLSRAIGSQLNFEDGRTLRLNRHQDGAPLVVSPAACRLG